MCKLKSLIRRLILFLAFPFLSSCEEVLDGVVNDDNIETINGFSVAWRGQITPQQKDVIREILNDMVLIEGGSFTMGATPEQIDYARPNEYPNIYVKLSNYYIGRHEVTDEQFNIITGYHVSATENNGSWMSLNDWKLFLTILEDLCSVHFTFPTESQWEYAARGGQQSKGYIYPGSNELSDVHTSSHLNGSKIPNELGLFNMADLKSEWCADMYGEFKEHCFDFNRLNDIGKYHVVRGGNYLCNKESSVYYPTGSSSSYSSTMYYHIGYGQKLSDRELDYRHCRTTSRSYAYETEQGTDYIGCRLVINIIEKND